MLGYLLREGLEGEQEAMGRYVRGKLRFKCEPIPYIMHSFTENIPRYVFKTLETPIRLSAIRPKLSTPMLCVLDTDMEVRLRLPSKLEPRVETSDPKGLSAVTTFSPILRFGMGCG